MKCPKCGCENEASARFCVECGEKLNVEKYLCPSCKAEVKKGSKFCPSCGHQLEWDGGVDQYENIPIPVRDGKAKNQKTPEQVKNSNKDILPLTTRIVFACLVGIGFILMFIGCFGDVVKPISSSIGGLGLKTTTFRYFYGEAFDELFRIKTSYKYLEYYHVELVLTIIHEITYFLMFASIIVFAIISGINIYKCFKGEKAINIKPLGISVGFTLLFVSYTMLQALASFKLVSSSSGVYSLKSTLGWGTTLLIVGCALLIVACIAKRLIPSIVKKQRIVSGIFGSISIISLLLFCLLCSAPLLFIKYSDSGIYGTGHTNVYANPLNTLSYFSSGGTKKLPDYFTTDIAGMILVTLGLFLSVFSVIDHGKSYVARLIAPSLGFVLIFVGGILSVNAYRQSIGINAYSEIHVGFSAAFIIGIIMFVLFIASSIAKMVVSKKEA